MGFQNKEMREYQNGKMGFLENKGNICLDGMDGDSCVGHQMVGSYLCG